MDRVDTLLGRSRKDLSAMVHIDTKDKINWSFLKNYFMNLGTKMDLWGSIFWNTAGNISHTGEKAWASEIK